MQTIHRFNLRRLQFISGSLLLSMCLLALWLRASVPTAPADSALHDAAAVEQLKQDGSYSSLAAAMNAARYHLNPQGSTWEARNPAQQFRARFTPAELQLTDAHTDAEARWQASLKLTELGRGNELLPVGKGELTSTTNRVEIRKANITEWYVNKPEGLEQGFTVPAPLSKHQSPLLLKLQLTGELRAKAVNDQAIHLQDKQGRTVLSYDHLAAWDAQHKTLSAKMRADGRSITLEVDDANAVYPITIDPTLTQTSKLVANDGAQNDRLGEAVALSGDTAVVGAKDDDAAFADQGSAYVFVRNGTAWTQQAKLTANDAKANDHFGNAVAIDGNTIVVGAAEAAFNGMANYGAAYVFTRSGATWTQQQKLILSNSDPQTYFGSAVAVRGNTAAIGAYREDSSFFGFPMADNGAVYIFTRNGATWTQQAHLVADTPADFDQMGRAVALHGETLVAGAFTAGNKGAAFVFTRNGTSWSQQAKLVASDGGVQDFFGEAVALGQDVAVIGAPQANPNGQNNRGAAYVYTRSGNVWTQQTKLTASDGAATHNFGRAVAFNGECIAVGASRVPIGGVLESGAAYLFTRNGTTWVQQQKFSASDAGTQAYFGAALALSDSYLIAGAWGAEVNGNSQQGAVYTFQLSHSYPLTDTLSANDGTANDHFGLSVAVNSTVAAIGAPDEDINGQTDQGAVYVFTRNSPAAISWTFQQKLTNGTGGDHFGSAVAIGNGVILIGVPADDVFGSQDQGSVYAYTFSANAWNFQQQVFAADPGAGDKFGTALSLSGSTAIVGSPYATIGGNAGQGAAYVFVLSGNTWTQQQKLTASGGTADDRFGAAVAVDSNTAVVGAPARNVGANVDQGAAYVFTRASNVWSQQAQLTANDGNLIARLGTAVAVSGDTALAGAPWTVPSGAAYVFTRAGATWSQQAKLKASDESGLSEYFGYGLALSGNSAVVGAMDKDINGVNNQGAAYAFTRSGSTWTQQQKLLAGNGQAGDEFGYAVALDSATKAALVGAPYRNSGQGAAYFFSEPLALSIVPGTLPAGTVGVAYNQTLNPSIGTLPYAFFLSNGNLPAGLSLSFDGQAAATISGTPKQTGTFSFTVGVNDANGFYGTQNYTLTINCGTLDLTPTTLPAMNAGQFYNQPLTVAGGAAPYTYSKTAGTFPAGITISFAGAVLGTPTTTGSGSFTITVTDVNGCTGARTYNYTVGCSTITVNPATLPSGTVGQGGYNQPLSAQGGMVPYTFSLNPGASLPPGLSLVNGAITGGPQQGGTFNFTIRATDANGCQGTRAYTFTANCQTLTVFPGTLPGMTAGVPFSQGLSASGSDGPFTYSLAGGALPNGITLSNDGLLSGTPTTSGGSSGSFTINVADVFGCVTAKQYNFSVTCPTLTLNPPSLPDGATGVAYNQTLTTTGGVAPYSYSITAGALPPGLALATSGALTGLPTQAGTFNFTVTSGFGGSCTGQQSYMLTITQSCNTVTINPASLVSGTQGAIYNVQLDATGATGNISYNVSVGTLPNGVTLSASGLLSGAATENGVFNFTVTATDANNCTGQKAYSLTITCPTITVAPTPPNGSVGNAYNHTFNATGNVGPYGYTVTAGALPAGLTLAPAGTLTGTPTTTGTFNFTIRAGNAGGCSGENSFAVTIIACQTINIVQPSLPDATVGTAYNVQLNVNGGVGPYSWSLPAGVLPNGLSLTAAGLLVGTPTQAGNFAVSIRATDVNGCIGDRNYVLVVSAAGCPSITVTPVTLPNGVNGAFYSQQLSASGGSGSYTFALTAGSFPSGLTLTPGGLLSGTIAAIGVGSFRVTATDANLCIGSRDYQFTAVNCSTITINPATLPNGQMGGTYNQTLSADGGVAPYTYSVSVGTLPNGLTLTSAGVLSGTPTVSGQFGFTVQAVGANGCIGTRSYTLTTNGCSTITVNPASLPNGTLGAVYNQTLTASGGTGPYVYSLQSGAWPAGVSLSGAGALTGTPTANGSFNVTVKATDANGCIGTRSYTLNVSATCPTITVNPANLPGGFAGTAYNQVITASGGTGPYTFTVDAGVLPNGVTLSNAGVLSGTPVAAGSFNFTIKATDAQGCAGTRAYTVNFGGAGLMFYPLPFPLRLLDTRAGQQGCDTPGAPIAGGTARTQLARRTCNNVTIPANALAVTGNVTTVQSGGGYLTLYPSNAGQPLVANTNFAPNEILNNVFTVGLGNDGAFKIFATSNTDVVVDVTGYYAPPSAQGLYFHPLPQPLRLLDTRAGQQGCFTPGAPLAGGADTLQLGVATCGGVTIPAAARALVGNATTVNPQAGGYLTLFPADAARPLAASSNYGAGQVMNAPFTVGLSVAGAFKMYTTATTELVIDVAGYYSTEANDVNGQGLLFTPLPQPIRLLETRAAFTGCYTPSAPLGAGSTRNQQARGTCSGVTVAQTARAIVGNATVVGPSLSGYLTFWPNGAVQPLVAASNYQAGQIFNRHCTVGLGVDGMFNIFTTAQTELVIDVSGFFAP